MPIDIEKALNVTDAGSVLLQPDINKEVEALVEYKNPIRQNLPRKPGSGDGVYVNMRTPTTTVADFVADTDTLTERQATYAQTKYTYRTIAARGCVTRKLIATGRSYTDVWREELEGRALDFKDYEDWALIWADADTTNQFDGVDALITSTQTVTMTTSSGGTTLTLAKMDEVIDTCSYEPDMIICSKACARKLNALLQTNQRFIDRIEVKGGFKVMSYNDIPVYRSTNVYDTQTFDGTEVTANTGDTTTTLFVLDTDHLYVSELTALTVEQLAKTSSQNTRFDIYEDITVVLNNTKSCAKLIGIDIS